MFATCSDDNTVSIWDIRFLKNKIRCLKGHANWVKNIEYAHDVGLLVTSGFDGSVYTWDINRLVWVHSISSNLQSELINNVKNT